MSVGGKDTLSILIKLWVCETQMVGMDETFNWQIYTDGLNYPAISPPIRSAGQTRFQVGRCKSVTVRPSHLPNSSIKGDGVRVFLSERDHAYR
jgi:hypothetical protein